jgi:hypothetical protein
MALLSACDRSLTRAVHDGAKLTSRVQEIVRPGSDSAAARRVLEVQGFQCATRLGSEVDTLEKGLEPPADRITCQKSEKAQTKAAGVHRYLVDVLLEGPTVRGIEARMWSDSRQ